MFFIVFLLCLQFEVFFFFKMAFLMVLIVLGGAVGSIKSFWNPGFRPIKPPNQQNRYVVNNTSQTIYKPQEQAENRFTSSKMCK